jgi:predicted transcriptional regulator
MTTTDKAKKNTRPPMEKTSIQVPPDLIARIDNLNMRNRRSRSATILELMKRGLGDIDGDALDTNEAIAVVVELLRKNLPDAFADAFGDMLDTFSKAAQ